MFRNEVRTHLNQKAVIHRAVETRQKQGWAAPAPELTRLLGAGSIFHGEPESKAPNLNRSYHWSRSRRIGIVMDLGSESELELDYRLHLAPNFSRSVYMIFYACSCHV